jgi:hypothetical protein
MTGDVLLELLFRLPSLLGVIGLALLAWRTAAIQRTDHLPLMDRVHQLLGRPLGPLTDQTVPGSPPLRLEEWPDGSWSFVAPWPDGVRMTCAREGTADWFPDPALIGADSETVTTAGLDAARAADATLAVDGLRYHFRDPRVNLPGALAQLRAAWAALARPTRDQLAASVAQGPAHLRGGNLRALAARHPSEAARVAATVGEGHGPSAWVAALELRRDVARLQAEVERHPNRPDDALAALARVPAAPDGLLALAETCRRSSRASAFADQLVAHPTAERVAFVRALVVSGDLGQWPARVVARLSAWLVRREDLDEVALVELLRAPEPTRSRAADRLAARGSVAVVPRLRALADQGLVPDEVARTAILAIQARATGASGGLAVAEASGGDLSEVTVRAGQLSRPRQGE